MQKQLLNIRRNVINTDFDGKWKDALMVRYLFMEIYMPLCLQSITMKTFQISKVGCKGIKHNSKKKEFISMNAKEYKKINTCLKEILDYFSKLKNEREKMGQELTKEEHHLFLSVLGIKQSLMHSNLRTMEKQERIREKNQEKRKAELFLHNEIVYEGVVAEYYNPVYAADYKELKRKISVLANLTPQEKDIVKINTYKFQKLENEETWIRKNNFSNGTWTFGKWEQYQPQE